MQTDIYYRDVTKTESLETFLTDKIEGLVEKYVKNDPDAHLTVRVATERHRTQNRKPAFTCELILKPTHSRALIKVKKTNEDFYVCVADAADALKNLLAHRSSKLSDHHRTDPMLALPVTSVPVLDEDGENFNFVTA